MKKSATQICSVWVVVLSLSAMDVGNAASESDRAQRPNVVFFLVDDMGWMDCGVYGSQYYETPNIDRFATRAMRFTDAYAQPLCSPSRASILTGQYTSRHGITTASGHQPPQAAGHRFMRPTAPPHVPMLTPESKNYLEPSQITLAETLQSIGYRTAHIGKWHIGLTEPYWPEEQGFEVAFHCHPDPGPPGEYFSPYGVTPEGTPTSKNRVGTITDGPAGEYIVDRQADEAIRFIRGCSEDTPFFLNLWCYGVHGPWGHKREYTEYFATKKDPTGRQGNPIMASMMKSVDDCFGRILDELDSQNIADHTIVIFYSDNGGNVHSNVPGSAKTAAAEKHKSEFLKDWRKWAGDEPPTKNTPLRDGKGKLYEGGTRVPLMWSWPENIEPGGTHDAIVGPIDFYPTLIELLDIAKPTGQVIDGVSYADVLTGDGTLDRKAYFNYHPHAGLNRAGGVWVRQGDDKLIRWFGNPNTYELFNLRDDLGESKNLAAANPDRVEALDALIDEFLTTTGALYPRPNPDFDPSISNKTTDPLDVWKQRGCTAQIDHGVLRVVGSRGSKTAFLGHATRRMTAPATVRMKVRAEAGGSGRIDCLPGGAANDKQVVSAVFEIDSGDWQQIEVKLTHTGVLGTMRIYLPVKEAKPIEIDQIEILPAEGVGERWEF